MSAESDLVVKAMVAVATADGHLDTREIGLIQKVYQADKGEMLTADEISRAVDTNAKGDVLDDFTAASASLGTSEKEDIVRAAYRVLLADRRISTEERKKLHDIAAALKLTEIHVGAILESLDESPMGEKE